MKLNTLICSALIIGSTVFFGSPTLSQARDNGWDIAMTRNIPGKTYFNWKGAGYTERLYNHYLQAGCEAHLIQFRWRFSYERTSQDQVWNMVVYRDAENRYWAIDSIRTRPMWVSGTDLQKWVDQMHPTLITTVLGSRSDPAAVGQYANSANHSLAIVPTPPSKNAPVDISRIP